MERVTKADILGIRPGETKTFCLGTAKAVVSARQYAYFLGRVEPRKGVAKYSVSADFVNHSVAITAKP